MGPGAPGFTAPEVLDRGELTPAADMFSLGCLAVALLRGELPDPQDPHAALAGCLEEPVAALAGRDLPGELLTILAKLSGRSAKRRYRNANEFLVDLAAFERGKPVAPFAAAPAHKRDDGELQALLARQRGRRRRTWTLVVILLVIDLALAAALLRTWRESRDVALPDPFQGFRFTLEAPR